MAFYARGISPLDVRLGDENVLYLYLGDLLVWDGTTPVLIMPPPGVSTGATPKPIARTGVLITIPVAAGTGTTPTPVFAGGITATAPAAVATGSTPTPIVRAEVVIAASATVGIGTAPAPSVGDTVIEAAAAASAGTVPLPGVMTGVTVTSTHAVGTGTAPAPVFSGGVVVAAPPAVTIGSAPTPQFITFRPAGMNKSGTQTLTTAWAHILDWVADTTGYPGSVVAEHALVVHGDNPAATITASCTIANSSSIFSLSARVAIYHNGAVLVEGADTPIPVQSSATVSVAQDIALADGDLITLYAIGSAGFSYLSLQSGATSHVRVTD
ncbi:hypothetical protein [Nocardia sp. CNY236]|uniref:hypothetical protein n=1 Tax=Nocardia sp. CNY236 TaxID=1169152 RepID=UPI00042007AD|nr:hypothetical protein [Nocardia sp. CNY236]